MSKLPVSIPARLHLSKDVILTSAIALVSIILALVPTGFEKESFAEVHRPQALVLSVNDTYVKQFGLVREGMQLVHVRILEGPFAGKEVDATNYIVGKLELDKVFRPGDKAIMVLTVDGDAIKSAIAYDQYRFDVVLVLLILFVLLLIGFAGWIGARALLSFGWAALLIWKGLIPGMLHGWDPIVLSLGIVSGLIVGITFLVAGISRKAVVAALGALLGILLTCILALVFYGPFHVHGAVLPFSETLLYSGFPQLDLTRIYLAGIFISASGALMDLSMDISAAMQEVIEKKPDIRLRELIGSGLAVGRVVTGTMVTTLLLAYAGGYSAMLMLFMGQGIPFVNIVSINYVAAEILKTMVGSFGLVTVAPFTAIVGGFIHAKKIHHPKENVVRPAPDLVSD